MLITNLNGTYTGIMKRNGCSFVFSGKTVVEVITKVLNIFGK